MAFDQDSYNEGLIVGLTMKGLPGPKQGSPKADLLRFSESVDLTEIDNLFTEVESETLV